MLSRKSLLDISVTCIDVVLEQLLSLLEEIHRPYKSFANHPPYVVSSEIFILSLAADCCTRHWDSLAENYGPSTADPESGSWPAPRPIPKPVDNAFVARMFEHFKHLRGPLADNVNIPARVIIDEDSANAIFPPFRTLGHSSVPSSSGSDEGHDLSTTIPGLPTTSLEAYTNTIIQFVTASNWPATFDYLRSVTMRIRNSAPAAGSNVQSPAMVEEEKSLLVILSMLSNMWIDGQKLGIIVQEFCSNFLHFRKSLQNTISYVMPVLVSGVVEHYPKDFARSHSQRRRFQGADTFFDMAQTMADSGKRKSSVYYPLQTCLLLLQPDVFEVASNFRDAKSSALAKKAAFLENLKKAARNRNESAVCCIVGSVHAARLIAHEGEEAGLVSWCWDIVDELREIVFPRHVSGTDGVLFDQELTTVAFVSLAEFNFDTFHAVLSDECLRPAAPQTFKIALIQACSFFAQKHDARRYRKLFTRAAPFIQEQLKVSAKLPPIPLSALLICSGHE